MQRRDETKVVVGASSSGEAVGGRRCVSMVVARVGLGPTLNSKMVSESSPVFTGPPSIRFLIKHPPFISAPQTQ
ncbi:hypothetical protein L195_g051662 [Trifolium pratense]|uniref:Uncharacterized protein n=1 Tax=Trifolium pratense TaxID=57577 RepID=A0A2K3K0W4_TRIPR|nr:hypothetical protein L195_g051662 [Trifolium pratense]